MEGKMYRIMVVEDDEDIRSQLWILLTNALYEVVTVEDFTQVPREIEGMHPDLVLLDMKLPGADGIGICEAVRRISQVPIIFVTGSQSPMDELNGILKGGDDYVNKPYQPSILLARIAAVLKRVYRNREGNEEEVRLKAGNVVLDMGAAALIVGANKAELSRNEVKLLYYLFQHKDQFVSRTDLMDYLWDQAVFVDDNTLSVNVTRIRKKAEELGLTDWIEGKRGLGYRVRTI
jgi:DNA-binding response OmpR family regulator